MEKKYSLAPAKAYAVTDQGVAERIQALEEFPKIQSRIVGMWGTVELGVFFGDLLSGVGGVARQRFAPIQAEALLALCIANQSHLEALGLAPDDAQVALLPWPPAQWRLAKNF